MNISVDRALAESVSFSDAMFVVRFKDARILSTPIAWFPRLASATSDELENYIIMGDGEGIHWPDLDEDISAQQLLLGSYAKVA